ncbi:MAG: hypothetical protein R3F59_16480 [Myxococcota bacterium]
MLIDNEDKGETEANEATEALDLFGTDVTPEDLESYMQSNYSTGAQKSLMTAVLLATL